YIAAHRIVKAGVRALLYPLVIFAYIMVEMDLLYRLLLILLSVSLVSLSYYRRIRRRCQSLYG
ncbi:MAG: hypothetical protein IH612_21560, partial [Desulfofustis sp.]|nr:hypothetical protein [Desulfofustis sp.]